MATFWLLEEPNTRANHPFSVELPFETGFPASDIVADVVVLPLDFLNNSKAIWLVYGGLEIG